VLLRVLLVLVVVGILIWMFGARSRSRTAKGSGPAQRPQAFARCAHCGVHLPVNDAVVDGGLAYCSEAHRLAGPSDRAGS